MRCCQRNARWINRVSKEETVTGEGEGEKRGKGEVCLYASCDKTQVARCLQQKLQQLLHLQRVLCFFLCDVHMSRCEINACKGGETIYMCMCVVAVCRRTISARESVCLHSRRSCSLVSVPWPTPEESLESRRRKQDNARQQHEGNEAMQTCLAGCCKLS